MVDRNDGRFSSKDRKSAAAPRPPKSRAERDAQFDRSRAGEKPHEEGGVLRELDEVKGQIL